MLQHLNHLVPVLCFTCPHSKMLDSAMFEQVYPRKFHFLIYTQEQAKQRRFFVRSDELHLPNTLSYLQVSIPKSNNKKRKQNAYLTTATYSMTK